MDKKECSSCLNRLSLQKKQPKRNKRSIWWNIYGENNNNNKVRFDMNWMADCLFFYKQILQQYRIHNNNNRAPTEGMQNNMHSYPAEFCSCALCNSESLKIGYIMYHDISDVVKS